MSLPKVSIVGAGQVGATTALLLAQKGCADITLIDIVEGLAQGKALDMMQSAPVQKFKSFVQGSHSYDALENSQIVVITAGLPRKPGMSREDLLAANANIVGPIAERVALFAPNAIIIVVTNPLDIMVSLSIQRSGFDPRRVMGMAGILDSARLRAFVAMRLNKLPSDVEAVVLGSHGDLMVPLKNSITVEGKPISDFLPDDELEEMLQRTKDGGAEIVKLLKKGSAFYAPASGVAQMVTAILSDSHTVLPVCTALNGEYGLKDVCIGVPARLGAKGIEEVVEIKLKPDEIKQLSTAADKVRESIKSLASVQASSS